MKGNQAWFLKEILGSEGDGQVAHIAGPYQYTVGGIEQLVGLAAVVVVHDENVAHGIPVRWMWTQVVGARGSCPLAPGSAVRSFQKSVGQFDAVYVGQVPLGITAQGEVIVDRRRQLVGRLQVGVGHQPFSLGGEPGSGQEVFELERRHIVVAHLPPRDVGGLRVSLAQGVVEGLWGQGV